MPMKIVKSIPEGLERRVALERFEHRAAAYAIILHPQMNKLAVIHTANNLWWLPGGGCEPWETTAEALRREVLEELSIGIKNVRCLGYFEHRFVVAKFISETEEAFCQISAFYAADPVTLDLRIMDRTLDPHHQTIAWEPFAFVRHNLSRLLMPREAHHFLTDELHRREAYFMMLAQGRVSE